MWKEDCWSGLWAMSGKRRSNSSRGRSRLAWTCSPPWIPCGFNLVINLESFLLCWFADLAYLMGGEGSNTLDCKMAIFGLGYCQIADLSLDGTERKHICKQLSRRIDTVWNVFQSGDDVVASVEETQQISCRSEFLSATECYLGYTMQFRRTSHKMTGCHAKSMRSGMVSGLVTWL